MPAALAADDAGAAASSRRSAACRRSFALFVLRVEGISSIETAASSACTRRPCAHACTARSGGSRREMARRVRVRTGFLELTPERLDRIVKRVLAQLPHGSI